MRYSFDFTVPANTLKAAPATLALDLSPGVVTQLEVAFPPGPNNEVKLVIYRSEHQVWPTNPDGVLAWDDYTMVSPEAYRLDEAPFGFQARAWSPGTTYAHTITIRLTVIPFGELAGVREAQTLSQRLLSLLGRG